MAPIDNSAVTELLTNGAHRSLVGTKRLTLAFGGLYIASTTVSAKPLLVWETEKGFYPRYYVPTDSLHADIKAGISAKSVDSNGSNGQNNKSVQIDVIETIKGKGNDAEAVIERLTIGPRSTTWVRFVKGPSKDYVRFEKDEIGRRRMFFTRYFYRS